MTPGGRVVRWMLPLLCVGCAAGARAPSTCGEVECAAACADAEAKVAVPQGGARLTAYEAERLADRLAALRLGVAPGAQWSVLWCTGATSCEQAVDPLKMTSLPSGPYVVALPLRVPSQGVWTVAVDVDCTDGGPPDQHVQVPVSPSTGVGSGPFVPVNVPSGWNGSCTASVRAPDGTVLGVAKAPFSTSPEPTVFLTAAQLAAVPPPSAAVGAPATPDVPPAVPPPGEPAPTGSPSP